MGGNALSVTAVRLTRKNFERVSAQCVERLQACFPGNRVAVIPAYQQKADFGDCDILVTSTGYDPHKAAAALDAVEVVRNGPVTSVGVVVRDEVAPVDGNVFQVDLISIGEDAFDYALGYFSFNDLGNLIGRTAHRAGLSHKHDGLWFYVRDGDYKFREICLTRDYDVALRFLGYEPQRFHAGFETLEDIFVYVAGSKFFNRDIFLLENRNAKSRIRDRKRRTYMEFLKWCEARPELPAYQYPDDKAAWLPRIAEHFPHFQAEYQQALQDMANQRAVKERFNGEWVSQLTGLEGKSLGALMKNVKESFGSLEALHQFVLGSTHEQLAARVREVQATLVL
ncbi:hypothetical protein WJ84_02545 [Burkholderia ubonensis]|nr:hypothetical protein WJ84_02545 [Burkholderia ubonensis]